MKNLNQLGLTSEVEEKILHAAQYHGRYGRIYFDIAEVKEEELILRAWQKKDNPLPPNELREKVRAVFEEHTNRKIHIGIQEEAPAEKVAKKGSWQDMSFFVMKSENLVGTNILFTGKPKLLAELRPTGEESEALQSKEFWVNGSQYVFEMKESEKASDNFKRKILNNAAFYFNNWRKENL